MHVEKRKTLTTSTSPIIRATREKRRLGRALLANFGSAVATTSVVSGSDISQGTRLIGSGRIFRLLHIRRSRITLTTRRKRPRCAFEIGPILEPFTVFSFSSKHAFGTFGIRIELQRHLAALFGFRAELAVG